MNDDHKIIIKILEHANIEKPKHKKLLKLYEENHHIFFLQVIKHNKNYYPIFEDFYIKNLSLSKISRKYLITHAQIIRRLEQVLDINLYLNLSKCKINFNDPLYERNEFNKLCLKIIGCCYEPLRLHLIKMYNLIEKRKDGYIYIIQEKEFNINKREETHYETQTFNFEMEFAKILSLNEEIVINDVLKMQRYIELSSSVLKPRHYQKFYDYVQEKYYKNGFDMYISKNKAMLSREWSLAKLKHKVEINRDEINFVLYDDIRRKDA